MAKDKKEPDMYVLKKTHDTKIGEMRHKIERVKDKATANFVNGTLSSVSIDGHKVTYVDGIASSVSLKNGIGVSYGKDFNGNETVSVTKSVVDKDGNRTEIDITDMPEGKKAAHDALKTILKTDVVVADISRSHDKWKDLPNFKGLSSWAKKAQQQFAARQAAAAARKKLLEVAAKGYANAEIAINSGASVEEVERARKKDEKVAADKATARAKENIKIRDEQRAEDRALKLRMNKAYQDALRNGD